MVSYGQLLKTPRSIDQVEKFEAFINFGDHLEQHCTIPGYHHNSNEWKLYRREVPHIFSIHSQSLDSMTSTFVDSGH